MSFRSTFAEIRSILELVRNETAVRRLNSRVRHDLELVLAEALNNVAEHAYDENVPGVVSLVIRVSPDLVTSEVRDFGRPFPDFARPRGNDVTSEDEGGRGLLLIRSLCSRTEYRRQGNENIMTLELVSSD